MIEEIKKNTGQAVLELIEIANLKEKDLLVIGCSSSEIVGKKIGTSSAVTAAKAVYDAIAPILSRHGIYLAAQCCEHLNRALILEAEAAAYYGYEVVSVVPQPHAGGSFAATVYEHMNSPVAVEAVSANAGMDIGDTLIGMHLKRVAVPVRLSVNRIGEANLVCARTRPKFIGGERAIYRGEQR